MPAVKKKRKMYFGQVTEDAIIKYNKEIKKALKFHTNTDESKLIVQFIKHTKNSQKAA